MKITLFGKGKMGSLIEQLAIERQISIVPCEEADVYIDFSHPDVLQKHLSIACRYDKPIVVGTTGWEHQYAKIMQTVKDYNIGFLHSPNFSIGMQIFFKLVETAAQYIQPLNQFEAGGIEMHHSQKVDSPSGTAKYLSNLLNRNFKTPISFSSLRCGSIPGTHSILFDSQEETITLTHSAKNRYGFACGALQAAFWLQGKKGIFTMQDVLEGVFSHGT